MIAFQIESMRVYIELKIIFANLLSINIIKLKIDFGQKNKIFFI